MAATVFMAAFAGAIIGQVLNSVIHALVEVHRDRQAARAYRGGI